MKSDRQKSAPWSRDRDEVKTVRLYIAQHYKNKTDLEVATHFGLTRLYIKDLRVRMKLNKDLDILGEIRYERRKPRSQLVRYNREGNKPLTILQKIKREIPLTAEEHNTYMQSKGYG